MVQVAPLSAIHVLVADETPPAALNNALTAAGVTLVKIYVGYLQLNCAPHRPERRARFVNQTLSGISPRATRGPRCAAGRDAWVKTHSPDVTTACL